MVEMTPKVKLGFGRFRRRTARRARALQVEGRRERLFRFLFIPFSSATAELVLTNLVQKRPTCATRRAQSLLPARRDG